MYMKVKGKNAYYQKKNMRLDKSIKYKIIMQSINYKLSTTDQRNFVDFDKR